MNKERAILTDTAASTNLSEAQKIGFDLIPFNIRVSNKDFTDFILPPQELYQRMNRDGFATTSAPNPDSFLDIYRSMYVSGAREIFSIHTGIKSGIRDNAELAINQLEKTLPELKIHLINTRTISLSQLFIVDEAQKMINQGAPSEEIIYEVNNLKEQTGFQFFPSQEGIQYLAKSGRVGSVEAYLASTLKITPTYTLNHEGIAVSSGKFMGEKSAIKNIVRMFEKDILERRQTLLKLGIAYTQNEELAQELKFRVSHLIEPETTFFEPREAGSVLAAHAGPGAGVVVAMYQ